MIIGIGTDIVKTARFVNMTEGLMARVYTHNERAYLHVKNHVSAAGLFAAKEAVAKALGTGFRGFWPSHVEIEHDQMGKPYVVLHDGAARVAAELAKAAGRREDTINLSISHTDTDAVAFVIMYAA